MIHHQKDTEMILRTSWKFDFEPLGKKTDALTYNLNVMKTKAFEQPSQMIFI